MTRRLALAAWLAALAWLTLRPEPGAVRAVAQSPWWCLACGQAGGADLLLNVVLFLPLGWLLARSGSRWRVAVGSGLALSLAIEVTQGLLLPGRDAALGDLLANTAGTALGWALVDWRVRPIGRRFARLSAPLALGALGLVLYGSATLLAPDLGGPAPLRLLQPPAFPDRPRYLGRISGLELLGAPGMTRVRATFGWSPPDTTALTPIVRLDDGKGWPIVAIDRRDGQVGIEIRTLASRWRLRTPTLAVAVPPGIRAGEAISLELTMRTGAIRLEASGGAEAAALTRPYGAQHGWLLLNPFTPTGRGRAWEWWTMLWLAGWGGLSGLGAATRRRRLGWGLAAVGLVAIATMLAGAAATPAELVAFAVGWLAAISSARSRRPPAGA